jgi:citronellol/citronellal dehydrogenase
MPEPPFGYPDLRGQVAVVTGASRGIGKALALALAAAGADIVVVAKSVKSRDKLPGTIHDTAAEIEALGREALPVQTNLRDAEQIEVMVASALQRFGHVDILVNNAGALHWKGVVDTPTRRFDLMMEVNARAAHIASHLVLPGMLARGSGCIVQVAPPLDLTMVPGKTGYCISKFGMSLLALGIAGEVADSGIRSCALWPATAVESQATINHGLGGPAQWRRADVVSDALLAILKLPRESVHGRCLLDEEALAMVGVEDLERYNCVEGGEPLRIVGPGGVQSRLWQS